MTEELPKPIKENEKLYRTEAIVIRRVNIGEADKILTLFTPSRGKIRAVAKGVRRTNSRMGGHVELFTQSRLLIAAGRNLDIITQTETINAFAPLRVQSNRLDHAFYAVELLDNLTEEFDPHPEVYTLLAETLLALNEGHDPNTTIRAYELHLLAQVGYRPQLQNCVRCTNPLEPVRNFFSPELGGALCPTCGDIEKRSLVLSVDALKVLRYLQRNEFASGPRLRLPAELRREMETVMRGYTRFLLEHDLKSAEYIYTP
jgi:DNA repair protein RecO (recombination protein O)